MIVASEYFQAKYQCCLHCLHSVVTYIAYTVLLLTLLTQCCYLPLLTQCCYLHCLHSVVTYIAYTVLLLTIAYTVLLLTIAYTVLLLTIAYTVLLGWEASDAVSPIHNGAVYHTKSLGARTLHTFTVTVNFTVLTITCTSFNTHAKARSHNVYISL